MQLYLYLFLFTSRLYCIGIRDRFWKKNLKKKMCKYFLHIGGIQHTHILMELFICCVVIKTKFTSAYWSKQCIYSSVRKYTKGFSFGIHMSIYLFMYLSTFDRALYSMRLCLKFELFHGASGKLDRILHWGFFFILPSLKMKSPQTDYWAEAEPVPCHFKTLCREQWSTALSIQKIRRSGITRFLIV